MESAADYPKLPEIAKKPELPDIYSVISFINKDRSNRCGCDALALKVHRVYKKIDPNYKDRLNYDFQPCCAICCNCHADRFDQENSYDENMSSSSHWNHLSPLNKLYVGDE